MNTANNKIKINIAEIYRNEVREYLRPDFPESELERVVKLYTALGEELDVVYKAIRESCRQVLQLASEKATVDRIVFDAFTMKDLLVESKSIITPDYSDERFTVNKQSILDVNDLIE